jgi:hypothetical protein
VQRMGVASGAGNGKPLPPKGRGALFGMVELHGATSFDGKEASVPVCVGAQHDRIEFCLCHLGSASRRRSFLHSLEYAATIVGPSGGCGLWWRA